MTLKSKAETIERYNNEIERLSKGSADTLVTPTSAPTTEDQATSSGNAALLPFSALAAQLDFARAPRTRDRDPFELLPGLAPQGQQRSGQQGFRSSFLPEGMSLNRSWRLKALARGPSGGIAQIQAGGEIITVYDGDEIELDGRAYTIQVEADGLVLSFVPKDPSSQKLKMRVR
jgi:hypothetical protein